MKRVALISCVSLFFVSMGFAQGSLRVDPVAAHTGDYGLAVSVSGKGEKAYVLESDAHQGEKTYRASFWFNPNRDGDPIGGNFPAGNAHVIFQAMGDNPDGVGNKPVASIELRRYGTRSRTVRVRAYCYYDNQSSDPVLDRAKRLATGTIALQPNLWHQLQLEIQTSSSNVQGEVDGLCRLSVIGGPVAPKLKELVGVVKNQRHAINFIRLGAVVGLDDGTVGEFFFDDFESFRTLAP